MKNKKTSKTYYVTVSIEVSAQFEVQANDIKSAKALARAMAESAIEVNFDGDCLSPDVDYLPIHDDAVEE